MCFVLTAFSKGAFMVDIDYLPRGTLAFLQILLLWNIFSNGAFLMKKTHSLGALGRVIFILIRYIENNLRSILGDLLCMVNTRVMHPFFSI